MTEILSTNLLPQKNKEKSPTNDIGAAVQVRSQFEYSYVVGLSPYLAPQLLAKFNFSPQLRNRVTMASHLSQWSSFSSWVQFWAADPSFAPLR